MSEKPLGAGEPAFKGFFLYPGICGKIIILPCSKMSRDFWIKNFTKKEK
ncbi:MAG: hypothetical protein ACLRQR_00170 [Merdimonas faecis]